MSVDTVLHEAESKMAKSVEHLQHELQTIRTGRANPALIDHVQVPYYGVPTALRELAQISAPEPRLLLVQVYDRGQVQVVEKAIRESGMGLNPASDGQLVRVPIPALTEERRKEFVKMVRHKAEEARVAVRNVRREENHRVQELAKAGEIAEDVSKRAQDHLQRITDAHVARIDSIAQVKEAEVLEV